MSAVSDTPVLSTPDHDLAPYRAICRSAILSTVLAVVSLPLVGLAIFSAVFQYGDAVPIGSLGAALALFAVIMGISGLSTIRRYPTEYTGKRLATTGLVAGAVLLLVGASLSAYTHLTEVPEGYEPISFDGDLKPDPDRPDLPVSPKSLELSGKPVFIKGYMHPGVASSGKVNHFILVRDFGTCCFGGQPKSTHMIEVYVPDGVERVAYSTRTIKLSGTFMLADRPVQSLGLAGVWYHMQADQVK
jgi:Protein of unknown function (DUF3299)